MKKVKMICIIGWIVGAVLMILPFVLTMVRIMSDDAAVGIVGGAGWPTFSLILGECVWVAHLGVSIALAFVVIYLRHKRNMEKR